MAHSEILSGSGTVHELVKALVHTVHNHGGDDQTVRRLLFDPAVSAAVGKAMVGPIWDLVDKPQTVAVDWDSPWTDFKAAMERHFCMSCALCAADDAGEVAARPVDPCRYKLVHYTFPVGTEKVCADHRPAGIRELCCFLRDVTFPQTVRIVALGTRETRASGPDTFGQAMAHANERHDVCRINNQNGWETRFFFLVRCA